MKTQAPRRMSNRVLWAEAVTEGLIKRAGQADVARFLGEMKADVTRAPRGAKASLSRVVEPRAVDARAHALKRIESLERTAAVGYDGEGLWGQEEPLAPVQPERDLERVVRLRGPEEERIEHRDAGTAGRMG